MSDYKKRIGANIRNERTMRGISIDEFAEMLHLSTAFIGLIERGQRGAKLTNLIKIAEIFGITVNDLIYGTNTGVLELKEDAEPNAAASKKITISSLLYDLDELELDFIISTIRNLRILKNGYDTVSSDEDDNDYTDY